MKFELLLPCGGPSDTFTNLLTSIAHQQPQPALITILRHQQVDKRQYEDFCKYVDSLLGHHDIYILCTSTCPDYTPGNGVGYDRNFLVMHARGDMCYMIDQDNILPHGHLQHMLEQYALISTSITKDILLSPTILWRDTNRIQSRGIKHMYYLFPMYLWNTNKDPDGWSHIQMIGGNSLMTTRELFQHIGFDPMLQYSYEDIDFTYRMHLADIPVIVSHSCQIHHMEADKSFLATRFLHHVQAAYARGYNRVRRVKKTATPFNRIVYLSWGMWIQTVGFLLYCMIYGGDDRFALMQAVWKGSVDGFCSSL